MLTGITLTELAQRIEGNKALKRDYIADAPDIKMELHAGDVVLKTPGGEHPMRPLAHRQLSTFAGIPAQYYDRMKAEAPELLVENVNGWMGRMEHDRKRMVRTLGGSARALLSNSYQRVEHEEIAEVALPVLAELPNVQIVSCQVTEARLYIHFVVPSIQGEPKVGDIVQAGGIISNSEVGLGAVSVAGLLWRLRCLNGMKSGDTFRRAHVGRKVEDSEALWADDTRAADDKAILLKVRDMVKAVVDETRFRVQIDKLRQLADPSAKIENISAAVEVLSSKMGLTEGMRPSILQSLAEGGELTAWGMINAVTAQAHRATDYDSAVELESVGGQLLNLPSGEWKSILQAA